MKNFVEYYDMCSENGSLNTAKGRRFQKQAELHFPENELARKYYFWQRAVNDYSEQQALNLTHINFGIFLKEKIND